MLTNPLDLRRNSTKRTDLIATVVANDDSQHKDGKKRQRVRIRIPLLHRNVPDDELPWSMPISNSGQSNAGSGSGSVRVPPVGSKVFITLDEEDPHNPRYGGSPTTDDVNGGNELLDEDYPFTYGEIDQAGNLWKTNTDKNTQTMTHVSGTTIHISADGSVSIFSVTNIDIGSKGNITIAADGSIKLHAKGVNSIKGSSVSLNGSDAASTPASPGNRTRPNIANPSGKDNA